jgi:hypothetical protein
VDIGSWIVGAVRAVPSLLAAAGSWHLGGPRLTVESDAGVILPGNMKITVRNPGPREATIQDLHLQVRSHKLGPQTVELANLVYEGKGNKGLPRRIRSGKSANFNLMLGLLDPVLRERGYEGSCGLRPIVEDGLGNRYKGASVPYNIPELHKHTISDAAQGVLDR